MIQLCLHMFVTYKSAPHNTTKSWCLMHCMIIITLQYEQIIHLNGQFMMIPSLASLQSHIHTSMQTLCSNSVYHFMMLLRMLAMHLWKWLSQVVVLIGTLKSPSYQQLEVPCVSNKQTSGRSKFATLMPFHWCYMIWKVYPVCNMLLIPNSSFCRSS